MIKQIRLEKPFRYGKGSEHWNFKSNTKIIPEGILDDADLPVLEEKGLISVHKESANSKRNPCEPKDFQNVSRKESRVDYSKMNKAEAKELIAADDNLENLLAARRSESDRKNPRKDIISAIKRRVQEITGKIIS